MQFKQVSGKIIRGHGVASGQNGNPRFPGGTIQMQKPVFAARGLTLDVYFPGTINVSIHPYRYTVRQAKHTFRQIRWTETAPPEDFSFFDCHVVLADQRIAGLIYYPHPETKPEHFQDPATLELLMPFIEGLSNGMAIGLAVDPRQLSIDKLPDSETDSFTTSHA